MSQPVLIHPDRLLLIEVKLPTETSDYLALACAYTLVRDGAGRARVAIEIVYDPSHPNPREPYYCPRERLKRDFWDPRCVKKVKPYIPQTG